MRFLAHLLLFCILTLCVPNARASTIKRTTQIFTTVDGLPDNSINDIQKDEEGYLWIATKDGIGVYNFNKDPAYTFQHLTKLAFNN